MKRIPTTLATVNLDGEDVYQEIPEELLPDLAAAFAEAERLGPGLADEDCPICRMLKASGLQGSGHGGSSTGMSARSGGGLNRGERRIEASRMRRKLKGRRGRAS